MPLRGVASTRKATPVTQAQNIVCRRTIEFGQADQHIRWNIPLTQFIVAVDLLRTVQNFCHLLLRHIRIFAQIPDSPVQAQSPPFYYAAPHFAENVEPHIAGI